VVGCDTVWWDVARCGGMWHGVVGCGTVWWDVTRCGGMWHGVVGCGTVSLEIDFRCLEGRWRKYVHSF
jgi:hypothetical protein